MAVMGSVVKHILAPASGVPAESVYHVGIMPCFDKKLEASRDDLAHDVDTVLATNEVLDLLLHQPGRPSTSCLSQRPL